MKHIKGRSHLTWDEYREDTGFYTTKPYCFRVLAMAKCPDGKIRTIRLNQSSDTFFSHPGRTSIQGKSVTGYVTMSEGVLLFKPYTSPEGK